MRTVNRKVAEVKVLAALAAAGDECSYRTFRHVGRLTNLSRAATRIACRSLARKGLARYGKGLWTEDGEPAGSGYSATAKGRAQAVSHLVEKYILKDWD